MTRQTNSIRHVGSLHVADLARKTSVTPATVRYYARLGLLRPQREPENGYRRFSTDDVHRLKFVRQAQSLGLTIRDIRQVLEAVDHGEVPCHQVKTLVEKRLIETRKRISGLRELESRILDALGQWASSGEPVPIDGEFCPLIERVESCDQATANGNTIRSPSVAALA